MGISDIDRTMTVDLRQKWLLSFGALYTNVATIIYYEQFMSECTLTVNPIIDPTLEPVYTNASTEITCNQYSEANY